MFRDVVRRLSYDMHEAAYGGDATRSAARLICRQKCPHKAPRAVLAYRTIYASRFFKALDGLIT
jgi:hypothetical protein